VPINYWLMKSEPDVFGFDDLERLRPRGEPWNGVRNYQARNWLRDTMRKGDLAFFYHSGCDEPGIAGIMSIAGSGYPDPAAFDRRSPYFDPDSDRKSPAWYCVDVKFKRRLKRYLPLEELRASEALDGMLLLRRGNRLSVMPVEPWHWRAILDLEKRQL
jgi:predicted RNA-binding protein with PUA-like domain